MTYTEQSVHGTEGYNGHTNSLEEYINDVVSRGNGDLEQFKHVKQPVYIRGNAYLKGAKPYEREENTYVSDTDPAVRIVEEDGKTYLELNVEKGMLEIPAEVYGTEKLGMPRITEAPYENPDGTPIVFDTDYLGQARSGQPAAGPMEGLKEGMNRILVWGE